MSHKARNIVFSVLAAVGIVYGLVAGVWTSRQPANAPCAHVYIEVQDSIARRFVTADDLQTYLSRAGFEFRGKPMDEIDCAAIEQCLLHHDLIRTAECYKSPRNIVHVKVTQRIPVIYVVANDGCYYVDSDRKIMPLRASVKVNVLTLEGAVSRRAATEEYFDMAQWLAHDDYWSTRIQRVQVNSPRHIVLTQRGMPARILLGELDGYPQKMNKLQELYTHGFDLIGYPDYSEYDLRFAGQVVGRK